MGDAKDDQTAFSGPLQGTRVPLIRLEGIAKIYGSGEAEVQALVDVDLEIGQGEFVAIMGASGSGKSTMMNILGCLDTPSRGRYLFMGTEVGGLSRDQRALLRRNYLGFVFQGYNLLPRTTALENVEMPLVYQGLAQARRRNLAAEALHKVGLEGRESHYPSELSGGQQQRVAIARALVTEPSIILADEPTGNLDSARKRDIMDLLQDLNRSDGITILMVTHEPDMAIFASRIVTFADGRIVTDVSQTSADRGEAHGS